MTGEVDPLRDLLDVLDLADIGTTTYNPEPTPAELGADEDHKAVLELFEGRSQVTPHKRAFGGQVLAQSLIAAGRSVRRVPGLESRDVHSLHAYFIRPGDSLQPIRFAVENLRDGNSFSVRRVFAMQYGKTILSATLSFQEPASGLDHQADMPSAPDPQRVWTTAEELDGVDHPIADHWRSRAMDVRIVEGALFFQPGRQRSAHQNVWMRYSGTLPDDQLLNKAILAYASDYTLLESILRRHGLTWSDPRLRPASLDHSMWFHRPVHMDQWVLYQQESPSASGGRGLGIGKVFGIDGTLVATVAQEGMVRLKDS